MMLIRKKFLTVVLDRDAHVRACQMVPFDGCPTNPDRAVRASNRRPFRLEGAVMTTRLPTLAALALAALIAVPLCASAKTEARAVSGFHAVALGINARIEIRQGTSEALSISGDDDVVPMVETLVEKGVLEIRWKNERDHPVRYKELAIELHVRDLDAIMLGGSGRIHAAKLVAASFAAHIGGSGAVVLDALEAKDATATIAGSARLDVGGHADSLKATLAGSGELSAGKFEVRNAQATLQGSARAIVWARETLSATIAGSGEVEYYGRPSVRQTIAGSGVVKRLGDSPLTP
jgi:hypothetical protein